MVFLFLLAFLPAQILDRITFYPEFNIEVQRAKASEMGLGVQGCGAAMRNSGLEE